MSALMKFLFGQPGSINATPTVTPQQQQLLDLILGSSMGPLQQGFSNLSGILSGDKQAFEAPAMRQFQQEIVPNIAETFAGLGEGSQGSSAFAQTLGRSGADLAENLASKRADLQSNALEQLLGLTKTGLQPQFTPMQIPGQEGALQGIFKGLGSIGGFGASQFLGGGISNLLQGLKFFGGKR